MASSWLFLTKIVPLGKRISKRHRTTYCMSLGIETGLYSVIQKHERPWKHVSAINTIFYNHYNRNVPLDMRLIGSLKSNFGVIPRSVKSHFDLFKASWITFSLRSLMCSQGVIILVALLKKVNMTSLFCELCTEEFSDRNVFVSNFVVRFGVQKVAQHETRFRGSGFGKLLWLQALSVFLLPEYLLYIIIIFIFFFIAFPDFLCTLLI